MANAQTLTSITGPPSSLTVWSTAIFVPQIPTCAPATTQADTMSAGVAFRSGGRCYSVLTLDYSLGRKTLHGRLPVSRPRHVSPPKRPRRRGPGLPDGLVAASASTTCGTLLLGPQ